MKILVTGGTGFTGKRVLPLLKGKGEIIVFARKTSDVTLAKKLGYQVVHGDMDDIESLKSAMKDCDGLINIASIGFGHCESIITAATETKLQRAIFVSTTALFTKLPAQTKKVRTAAEKTIQDSTLNWTIIRPTMIYGGSDDRNMIRLLRYIKRWPVLFIPGNGQSLQQPIYVDDLAKGIVDAFFSDKTIKKSYNVSGKEALTFNNVVDLASRSIKKKVLKVHLPIAPMIWLLEVYGKLSKNPYIKPEQVLRLNEDKDFSHNEASKDFNFNSRSYEEGIELEVQNSKMI